MSTPIELIAEEATLEKAAARMLAKRLSALIVSSEDDDEPFGIVTSTDIVTAFARGMDPHKARVADVMSSPLLLVTPQVPVVYVARLMDRAAVRHVAVFNGRKVLGMISARDVLKAMMPENAGAGSSRHDKAVVAGASPPAAADPAAA